MINREISGLFRSYLKTFPVVVLTGARQVGKTTLLKKQLQDTHNYVLLEDPDIKSFAKEDPRSFFERYPAPLIIDEFQEVPELVSYLQGIVDKRRSLKGQYILTGSQNFIMMEQVTQSLAGRAGILELFSLSAHELKLSSEMSIEDVVLRILRGFYPEPALDLHMDSRQWYSSYFKTYVERDVRALTQVGDLSSFERFVRMLAIRTGNLLNLSEVARDSGVSPSTAERWLSILERTYIVYRLEPYFSNLSSRIKKSPKVYFYDVGLAAYLAGFRSTEALEAAPQLGGFFETLVISDLKKRIAHNGLETKLYFANMPRVGEVDLVWEQGSMRHMAEIKFSKTPTSDQAESLRKFTKQFGKNVGGRAVVGIFSEQQRSNEISYISWTNLYRFVQEYS